MEKHINVAASLQIGLSILSLIIGIFISVVLYLTGSLVDDNQAHVILTIIANVIVAIIVVCSLPGIIAGIGLFRRKEWARILTLIISVLHIVNFPLGTAVGVYCIWAMIQPEVIAEFKVQ